MSQQGQQNNDQTATFFWLLCIFVGVLLIGWWLARDWMITPIFWLRLVEINTINYVVLGWSKLANLVHLPVLDTSTLLRLKGFILSADPKTIEFKYFTEINDYVGNWVRYPAILIMVVLAVRMFFNHSSVRFRNAHSMDSLKKAEVENWPQITPVLALDLVKEDLEKGPWAMAKVPFDFCKENNLLIEKHTGTKISWSILRGPAYRTFALQLGPLWKGIWAQPIHVKALLVIFLARAEKERDVAKKFLIQLGSSAATGRPDFTGIDEALKKYEKADILSWLEKRHAYTYTIMASLLEIGRTDGVLASAEFLWLKPIDRRLWYVLNTVGRQTAFVEIAGPFAHWIAEKKVKQALKTPMVKEAVNALELSVSETLYIAEGDKWHTSNAA